MFCHFAFYNPLNLSPSSILTSTCIHQCLFNRAEKRYQHRFVEEEKEWGHVTTKTDWHFRRKCNKSSFVTQNPKMKKVHTAVQDTN